MVHVICRTLDDSDYYIKIPNVWRNFSYDKLNELLNIAFKLTFMPYSDVIDTNHSLINVLSKFTKGNDRVGDVEMDLLFGTILGEERPIQTTDSERGFLGSNSSTTPAAAPVDYEFENSLSDCGNWCTAIYTPNLLWGGNADMTNTKSGSITGAAEINRVARFNMVSKPLSRAHSNIKELLCKIVQ